MAIDCFKCVSINGDRSECDDPFHNNHSTALLEAPCMGGRKGRDGVFPATACVKISGYYGECVPLLKPLLAIVVYVSMGVCLQMIQESLSQYEDVLLIVAH